MGGVAVAERPRVGPVQRRSRRWTGLQPTGRTLENGDLELGRPILVSCHHDAAGLCGTCLTAFRLVLADVPFLLDQLDIAIAGAAKFVDRGTTTTGAGDEQPGGSHPAVAAHQRLAAALGLAADWFDSRHPEQLAVLLLRNLDLVADEPALQRVAREVSQAAARAHRVIDAPPELWFYGPCPDCGRDIRQERIHRDDQNTPVMCRWPSCGYASPLAEHHRRQLTASEDRWLTVSELVSAFELAGQPVTRDQINGWARRDGLPREMRPIVRWVDGQLHRDGEIATYRVGDIADMLVRIATKTPRTAR